MKRVLFAVAWLVLAIGASLRIADAGLGALYWLLPIALWASSLLNVAYMRLVDEAHKVTAEAQRIARECLERKG